eukprot:IDg20857t1
MMRCAYRAQSAAVCELCWRHVCAIDRFKDTIKKLRSALRLGRVIQEHNSVAVHTAIPLLVSRRWKSIYEYKALRATATGLGEGRADGAKKAVKLCGGEQQCTRPFAAAHTATSGRGGADWHQRRRCR